MQQQQTPNTAPVRRHVTFRKLTDPDTPVGNQATAKGRDIGNRTANDRLDDARTGQPDMPGRRAVTILTRVGDDELKTPVFAAGEGGGKQAVAVFTSREKAILYLQVAGWKDYEVRDITPIELSDWLKQARAEGVDLAVVDL